MGKFAYPQVADLCAEQGICVAWVNLGMYVVNFFSRRKEGAVQEWLRIDGYTRPSILLVAGGRVVNARVLRIWADSEVVPAFRSDANKMLFRQAVEELIDGLL